MFFHNTRGNAPASRRVSLSNRGSFLVTGAFFFLLFLLLAVFGLDLGRYLLLVKETQSIADGATRAAGQAFNQVRTLENIEQDKIVQEALRYIDEKKGYTTSVYEYRAAMKSGDIQMHKFPPDADHPDTYFRVGVHALQTFEPFFLPRAVFGDDYITVQAHAAAEVVPVFSDHNLYDQIPPGPPIAPLRYALYSKLDIKPENIDCFLIGGDVHSDSGYVKTEAMTGNNCPSGGSYHISGNVEAGDPAGNSPNCGGPDPNPGCVVYENVDGSIGGDVIYETDYTSSNGPSVTGNLRNESPGVLNLPSPPTPESNPDIYPGPICIVSGNMTVNAKSDLVGNNGEDCSEGGTIYVKGDLKITNFSSNSNYTFVADNSVLLNNIGSMDTNDMFIMSMSSYVKFENINQDININATIYAPLLASGGLCSPVQPGCMKFEDATSHDIRIDGGLIAGTMAKFEGVETFEVNYKPHADLLPKTLVDMGKRPNLIPDYWRTHLID